jgi:hypothetical protein
MSFYQYLPLVIVPVVIWLFIKNRAGSKALVQKTEHMRAGAVAQRLGLQITQGDPNYHLALDQVETTVGQGLLQGLKADSPFATTLSDVSVHATGQPYQRPTEFHFAHKVELSAAIPVVGRTRTTTFGCTLTVAVRAQVPDFEILARTNQYSEMSRVHPQLPPSSFGNPMLDNQFQLFTREAALGPHLAQVVGEFAGQFAAHVVGNSGQLYLTFDQWMMYGFGDGAEILQYGLECVACSLEGRAAPATRPMPVNPAARPA